MARKKKKQTGEPVSPPGALEFALPGLVALLIVVRLLIPAEAASTGKTLWIVQGWLAVGLIWAWTRFRERHFTIRFGWCDAALWMIVLGHVVSALYVVFAHDGNGRLAMNGLWEWVGLGVEFFLIRQVITTSSAAKRLIIALVAVTVSLSGFGLWQHYVWYDRMRIEYEEIRSELDRLEIQTPSGDPVAERIRLNRIRELRLELVQQDIPLDDPGRSLFEARLETSSEPFGTFSLTNTFAGLLIAGLIPALALMISSWKRTEYSLWFVSLLIVGIVAYCLVLTKSRSAWVGLFAAVFLGGVVAWLRRKQLPTRWLSWLLMALALIAAGLSIAAFTGGFDREVLTEAPKSMQYRMQYWSGSFAVLSDRPILGAGPGNFREHYLANKAAESSEEIADPHNWVLDLWANGGLLAVIGAAGFCWFGFQRFFAARFTSQESEAGNRRSRAKKTAHPITVGAASAFLFIALLDWFLPGQLFMTSGEPLQTLMLGGGWLVAMAVLGFAWSDAPIPSITLGIATLALLVHWLASGGIEMPAVAQLPLLFLAAAGADVNIGKRSILMTSVLGLFAVALFVGCALIGWKPVFTLDSHMTYGDAEYLENNFEKAEESYLQAAEADSLSPRPHLRLAELAWLRWEQRAVETRQASHSLKEVTEHMEAAIARDPHSYHYYRKLGEWWLVRYSGQAFFVGTRNPADAKTAVKWYEQAVARYPNNSQLRAELSFALLASGRTGDAREEAQTALRLDRINREQGHVDRLLHEEIVNRLKPLAEK